MAFPLLPIYYAITAAATAYAAYRQIQVGKVEGRLAAYNAELARRQATDAITRGQTEEERHRRSVRMLIGRQRAVQGSSGAVVDTGSALRITEDAAALGELDALTIRNNAQREALGYDAHAIGYLFQGDLAKYRSRGEATGTILTGVSTILGGEVARRY